ncbi:hypothetical protein [Sorangium sp. So ce426]|uniref:hypothetical protein n=1 Tax=Sorangium sp. So ce426 TaxID=3133312 RepID=UPI003F5C1B99
MSRIIGGIAIVGALPLAYWLGTRTATADRPALTARESGAPDRSVSAPIKKPPVIPAAPDVVREGSPAEPESAVGAPPSEPLEPPQQEPSALEHRDRVVAELRASGVDRRLGAPASTVVDGWSSKLARFAVGGSFEKEECFAKGCFVTIVHPSLQDAEKATDIITRTGEFNGWQAGKMRSGPIAHDDGRVELTWVMYPPPPDGHVLPETLPPDNFEELMRRGSPQ